MPPAIGTACERLHFNDLVSLLFCDSDQIGGMFQERRLSQRNAVNLRATVVWGDGLSRALAMILDLSDTGLRLRLDEEETIGQDGYILFNHRMEPFQLVWQASRSAGLQFQMVVDAVG